MTKDVVFTEKQDIRNQRLNARGHEVLDPNPLVIYELIDPNTGEILQEGAPRPPSLQEVLARSMGRFDQSWEEGDEHDDDFDVDEEDGSMPDLSPHSDGFVDSMGMTPEEAVKVLKKTGKLPQDFELHRSPSASKQASDEPPASPRKGPAGKKSSEGPKTHEGASLPDPDDQ